MNLHIFDRSDLDETVAYSSNSGNITRRMELARDNSWVRQDVVLMNGTHSGSEYALYVAKSGFAGDLWLLDVLTRDQYNQVRNIANRMRENAKIFPPAGRLLY